MDERVCAQYRTGCLSQKVQKVELSGGLIEVGFGGGGSHLMATAACFCHYITFRHEAVR
jgi:hypothetical protein